VQRSAQDCHAVDAKIGLLSEKLLAWNEVLNQGDRLIWLNSIAVLNHFESRREYEKLSP
jgi:hypothetical protein